MGLENYGTERAAKTSAFPFAALFQGRVRFRDLHLDPLRAVAALALYVTLLGAHSHLIGVSPLPSVIRHPGAALALIRDRQKATPEI